MLLLTARLSTLHMTDVDTLSTAFSRGSDRPKITNRISFSTTNNESSAVDTPNSACDHSFAQLYCTPQLLRLYQTLGWPAETESAVAG